MCRGYHITTTFTKYLNSPLHLSLNALRGAKWQKPLLVNGAPEGKPITKLALKVFRLMARHIRLDGVENFQAHFGPISKD